MRKHRTIIILILLITINSCSHKSETKQIKLGDYYYKNGQLTDALKAYNSVKKNQEILYKKAKIYYIQKKQDKLIETAKKADPSKAYYEDILYLHAKMLYEKGERKKSLIIISKGLKRNPDNIKLLFLSGEINYRCENHLEAFKSFSRLTSLYPYLSQAHIFFIKYYNSSNNSKMKDHHIHILNEIKKYEEGVILK